LTRVAAGCAVLAAATLCLAPTPALGPGVAGPGTAVVGLALLAGDGGIDRSTLRDAAVDAVDDPILVVADGRVLDANGAFASWFGVESPAGGALSDVLADQPTLRDHIRNGEEGVLEIPVDGETRSVEVSVSPVREDGDRIGRLALLHDVTERQRGRRELERQNEQLDQFAGLISHDLRNPLDVAMGRTTVLAERLDDPEALDHLAEVADAHDRMRRIITDVLTLARQGRSIDTREPVPVADLADDAWSHVETGPATLTVETDRTVAADRERLLQVFENLFRNAVQHAGPEVGVTVGDLDGGISVADDGPGIPPDERDRVLEAGYTSHDDGTGLGLAIVRSIVEAHGWELSVEGSADGGARIEIRGLDREPPPGE
jgi:signal transduction histidine kinase